MDRIKIIHLEIPQNATLLNLFGELSNLTLNKSLTTNLPGLYPQSIISHADISAPQLLLSPTMVYLIKAGMQEI